LRAWVKCGFSSAATSTFYTFKICTSADPHFTPGHPMVLRDVAMATNFGTKLLPVLTGFV